MQELMGRFSKAEDLEKMEEKMKAITETVVSCFRCKTVSLLRVCVRVCVCARAYVCVCVCARMCVLSHRAFPFDLPLFHRHTFTRTLTLIHTHIHSHIHTHTVQALDAGESKAVSGKGPPR